MTEDQRLQIMKEVETVFLKHNRGLKASEELVSSKDIVFILGVVAALIRGRIGIEG